MQTSATGQYRSTLHAATHIITRDGLIGLYRGVSPVLAGTPPILAINFWAYYLGQQFMYRLSHPTAGPVSLDQLNLFQIGCAGSISSIPTSFLVGPAEQIKIRLQIQETKLQSSEKGMFSVIKQIFQTGGLRGLFRGTGLTLLRDVPSGYAYFVTYEGMKRYQRKDGVNSIPSILLSGGCFDLPRFSWYGELDDCHSY